MQKKNTFKWKVGKKIIIGDRMYNNLEELKQSFSNCQKCKLCKTRNNIVFGSGNPSAEIMFIGEGPGGDEDRLGEPFVGKAGQLMNKAFDVLGSKREEV